MVMKTWRGKGCVTTRGKASRRRRAARPTARRARPIVSSEPAEEALRPPQHDCEIQREDDDVLEGGSDDEPADHFHEAHHHAAHERGRYIAEAAEGDRHIREEREGAAH